MSAYGPLNLLADRVNGFYRAGQSRRVLEVADGYERYARTAGDDRTANFLLQAKMYAYLDLGRHREALATGAELLRRQQACGYVLGEAKVLADLAELSVLEGQHEDGMRYLARAGILLDRCPSTGERYLAALSSMNDAAYAAELYETAAATYERLAQSWAASGMPDMPNHNVGYAAMMLLWGLRLEQLGRDQEASVRLRKAVVLTRPWLATLTGPSTEANFYAVTAIHALALAKLGQPRQAHELATAVVVEARRKEVHWAARLAHLALGVSARATGDLDTARRELLAAEQLIHFGARNDERLVIRHELAVLAAHLAGPELSRHFLDAIVEQARQLWDLRLQRLAMLRQARQREELDARRAAAERAMLTDPLTGLTNRRGFDRMLAQLDAAPPAEPIVLLVIDVDEFKAINDTYSHSAGDKVLAVIADAIAGQCRRGTDFPARYAGDEFAIFLREADLGTGLEVAERIRQAVREADVDGITPGMRASISIGAAALRPGMTGRELFQAADQQLYESKRHGRNRVSA